MDKGGLREGHMTDVGETIREKVHLVALPPMAAINLSIGAQRLELARLFNRADLTLCNIFLAICAAAQNERVD